MDLISSMVDCLIRSRRVVIFDALLFNIGGYVLSYSLSELFIIDNK